MSPSAALSAVAWVSVPAVQGALGFERAWCGWNIAAMLVFDELAARFGMEEVPPSERNSPPLVARLWPALIFG